MSMFVTFAPHGGFEGQKEAYIACCRGEENRITLIEEGSGGGWGG